MDRRHDGGDELARLCRDSANRSCAAGERLRHRSRSLEVLRARRFLAADLHASEVRVPDYLDEWLSATYPPQQKDREVLLPGLQWLEDESHKRFTKDFAALSDEQKRALADDICWPADAKPEFKKAAAFFVKFRALAASAYYST